MPVEPPPLFESLFSPDTVRLSQAGAERGGKGEEGERGGEDGVPHCDQWNGLVQNFQLVQTPDVGSDDDRIQKEAIRPRTSGQEVQSISYTSRFFCYGTFDSCTMAGQRREPFQMTALLCEELSHSGQIEFQLGCRSALPLLPPNSRFLISGPRRRRRSLFLSVLLTGRGER